MIEDSDGFGSLESPIFQRSRSFLALDSNLNVIYGRNGAGKTRLLRSLAHLLDEDSQIHEAHQESPLDVKLLIRIYWDQARLSQNSGQSTEGPTKHFFNSQTLPLFAPFMTPTQIKALGEYPLSISTQEWDTVRLQMGHRLHDRLSLFLSDVDTLTSDVSRELLRDDMFLLSRYPQNQLRAEPVFVDDESKPAYTTLRSSQQFRKHYETRPQSIPFTNIPETNFTGTGWTYEVSDLRIEWFNDLIITADALTGLRSLDFKNQNIQQRTLDTFSASLRDAIPAVPAVP